EGGPVRVRHVPGLDDLPCDVLGQIGRYGEADALRLPAALRADRGQRRDADHAAGGGHQRPAAVAGVDRRAGLDRVGQRRGGRAGVGRTTAGRVAEMMPSVTLPARPSGLPTASTTSPAWALLESPNRAGVRPAGFSARITARSPSG